MVKIKPPNLSLLLTNHREISNHKRVTRVWQQHILSHSQAQQPMISVYVGQEIDFLLTCFFRLSAVINLYIEM